ncbi:phosphoesterase RecJ domain-containing protein [Thermosyntropha lipolytica DSM 11003]|uniref:Phosphoesterase RecJ domain-containing protein n=1 Tax=Thermosyntropha lipolytica DSM 11003 TaxID=1123382 RepID=A0A1M5KVB3_9FIRM|nr:DHH family phosphoesterase [Thermosyntropha lipolytica]SHG56744.1 phosphoesterase RecJ domain-containing protein [Thermosyntropha lipolytica DSM 11003]
MPERCTLREIGEKLRAEDNYYIIGHIIPDGDCVGSLLGLYLGLTSLGKKAAMVLEDGVPDLYHFLAAVHTVKSSATPEGKDYNLIFLDCSDRERAGGSILASFSSPKYTFNIDHHATNDFFAHYNYVDPTASSTAEIVYNILDYMGVDIDSGIAEALYTGMLMDTGSFQYSNTRSSTLRIAAHLLEKGVDLDKLRINLWESKDKKEILLLSKALQSLEFSSHGKIAWMTLSYKDVESIGALGLHPEGIINYTHMIKGVEVGILFREISPGMVKIGFRSKGEVDVAALASKIGGGGHKKAAGASREGSLEEVKIQVLAMVEEVVK